jgi:hypothetical protein
MLRATPPYQRIVDVDVAVCGNGCGVVFVLPPHCVSGTSAMMSANKKNTFAFRTPANSAKIPFI